MSESVSQASRSQSSHYIVSYPSYHPVVFLKSFSVEVEPGLSALSALSAFGWLVGFPPELDTTETTQECVSIIPRTYDRWYHTPR